MGYDEGLIRPDLLIVEAGRGEVINPKRKDREAAILGKSSLFSFSMKSPKLIIQTSLHQH